MTTIKEGTPRYDVTAVFGKPVESYQLHGKDVDVFQADPDGRTRGGRVAISSFNAVADVLTIGMWEVVATPAEMITKHNLTTYVVTYTPQQTVESIETVAQKPPIPSDLPATASVTTAADATLTPPPASTQSAQAAATASAVSAVTGAATPAPLAPTPIVRPSVLSAASPVSPGSPRATPSASPTPSSDKPITG